MILFPLLNLFCRALQSFGFQGDLPPVIKKLEHHLMDVFGHFVCMLRKVLRMQYF